MILISNHGRDSQNTEKIANLAKVTENHKQALREIQKHLQALKIFMQSLAEAEDKHQQSQFWVSWHSHPQQQWVQRISSSKPNQELEAGFSKVSRGESYLLDLSGKPILFLPQYT